MAVVFQVPWPVANLTRRNATNYRIRIYIFGYHCTSCHHRTITYFNTF